MDRNILGKKWWRRKQHKNRHNAILRWQLLLSPSVFLVMTWYLPSLLTRERGRRVEDLEVIKKNTKYRSLLFFPNAVFMTLDILAKGVTLKECGLWKRLSPTGRRKLVTRWRRRWKKWWCRWRQASRCKSIRVAIDFLSSLTYLSYNKTLCGP